MGSETEVRYPEHEKMAAIQSDIKREYWRLLTNMQDNLENQERLRLRLAVEKAKDWGRKMRWMISLGIMWLISLPFLLTSLL